MKYQIIDLVIAVHQRCPILRLQSLVLEEAHRLLEIRKLPNRLFGLNIDSLFLTSTNGYPCIYLARIEPRWLAEFLQTDFLVINSMEACQSHHGITPHGLTLSWLYAWHSKVLKDTPIKKLHDVERRSYDRIILAKTVCLRDSHISVLQSMHNTVFALDLVSGLGKKLSRWLLAHHEALAIGSSDLVRGIGLAKTKLF